MIEKPAQALLKILRDNDRAVNPSPPDLQSLGLKYDAELSALVSAEYSGFVVQSQESKRFYFYSRREQFYGYGDDPESWGDWQVTSISNVRNIARVHVERENEKFRQASDLNEDARWNHYQSEYVKSALAEFAKEYQKQFWPNGASFVPVFAAFRSETQDFLILANNHVVCLDRLTCKREVAPLPFLASVGALPSKIYFTLKDAIRECIEKPVYDIELMAEWEDGYPVYGIVSSLHDTRLEEASFLEYELSRNANSNLALMPDIER